MTFWQYFVIATQREIFGHTVPKTNDKKAAYKDIMETATGTDNLKKYVTIIKRTDNHALS